MRNDRKLPVMVSNKASAFITCLEIMPVIFGAEIVAIKTPGSE